jgi:hypothetical protein
VNLILGHLIRRNVIRSTPGFPDPARLSAANWLISLRFKHTGRQDSLVAICHVLICHVLICHVLICHVLVAMAGVSVVVKAVLLWRRQSALMAVAPKMANSNQAAAKFKIEAIRRRPVAGCV